MKVSFKGINNIYILQGKKDGIPFYAQDNDGKFHNVVADINNISLMCELDDEGKKDLNDYYVALAKYKDYRKFLLKADNFDSVNLAFSDVDVYVDSYKQNIKMLILNGQELNIEDDSILPLFTFLASLTKRISNYENIDSKPKSLFLKLNSAIHKKACEYLDIEV